MKQAILLVEESATDALIVKHALRKHFVVQHAAHMTFNELDKIGDCYKFRIGANPVGSAGPYRVQHVVKKLPALKGGESSFRRVPLLRVEARRSEGLESAPRLGG